MKKVLLSVLMLFMASAFLYGQQDVTRFLGIPVDGSKSEMIQKLKEKGFVSVTGSDMLEGEFNGTQVYVSVVTNNNKVWRIVLMDKIHMGETSIKIRFNELCRQFENNDNYIGSSDQRIADDEDISYEMTVNDKRYQAAFSQVPMIADTVAMANKFKEIILQKYSEEELENPTEEIETDLIKMAASYATDLLFEKSFKKSVWFMISSFRGKYYIAMYYDNKLNEATGEDL